MIELVERVAGFVLRRFGGVRDELITRPPLAFTLGIGAVAAVLHSADFTPGDHPLHAVTVATVFVAAGAVLVQWLASLALMRRRKGAIRAWAGWHLAHLGALLGIVAAVLADDVDAAVAVASLYLLAVGTIRLFGGLLRTPLFGGNPARSLIFTFAAIILLGAAVLHLSPRTVAEGAELGLLDALFTATSATCVTGLETVGTARTFTPFGQGVILALIQVGGLGIMTFGTFLLLTMGHNLGLRDARHVQGVLNTSSIGGLKRLVVFIFVTTFAIEAMGAVALYPWFADSDAPVMDAVFHAVSAFCNAGFSLRADSLQGYADQPGFNLVVMTLIVLGGLGYTVLHELWARATTRPPRGMPRQRLSLHTRIVLGSSLALVVVGALAFWALEHDGVLAGRGAAGQATAAVFQSVSARTAGFATVPFGGSEGIRDATRTMLVPLMGIGASPGSAGGGMKTVTFVVLLLAVVSFLRGRESVELFGRRLAPDVIKRCSAIALVYAVTLFLGVFTLQLSDGEHFSLEEIVFEAMSALGTVGFSVDVSTSSALSPVGKVVFIVLMFLGRLGPLTLVLLTSGYRDVPGSIRYPEERVMVG